MEWTKEYTINFINSYRCKEILWDTKHPNYYNKMKKNDAWEELAVEFGRTVDECKRKINYLLTGLRREKVKMKRSHRMSNGLSEVYESSWFAFKSLVFLWDKNKVRGTRSTIADNEGDDDEKEISGDEKTLTDNNKYSAVQENRETIENMPKRQMIEAIPCRKRQKRNEDSEKSDEAFKILPEASAKPSKPQEQTECQIFGNLVAQKLIKYCPALQINVQQDIMNVLFKADMIHHKQSSTNFEHSQSQQSQLEHDQDSQVSNFTVQYTQVPSPGGTSANSSISSHSNRSTPLNYVAHELLDMPEPYIKLEKL